MAIYITGDIHGGFDLAKIQQWTFGQTLTRSDYLIVAGDFGYPWDFSEAEEEEIRMLEQGPYTVLFIDGNHERFDLLNERPVEEWKGGRVQRLRKGSPIRHLMRGEVYNLDGNTLFTFGGADSIDKALRDPGYDWWPCEMPSAEEYAHARDTLAKVNWQVDYVITHTCSDRMLSAALYPEVGWDAPNTDELTGFLDELEDKLEFKHWYFGHMHVDRDLGEKHTLLFNEIVELGGGIGA